MCHIFSFEYAVPEPPIIEFESVVFEGGLLQSFALNITEKVILFLNSMINW